MPMTAGLILLLLSSFMVTADHDCTKKDYLKSFHSTEESNCQRSGKPLVCMMPATSPSTAVMLYEPLTLLKPFHEEKRTFSVAGHTIHIHQKWEELGVSAVVWDAAIVLAEYLEREVSVGHLLLENKTLIELGAGTGLVSLATALLGGKIVSTDREDILDILRQNKQTNFRDDLSSFGDSINIQTLDWGENLSKFEEPFDLILGADIIYIENTFERLLATIRHLSKETTIVLLSCRIRYDRDLRFLEMLRQFYRVRKIHKDTVRGIDIYKATLL